MSSSAAPAATGVVWKSPVSIGTSLSVAPDGTREGVPVASVATPAEELHGIGDDIDRLALLSQCGCSLAREGKPACGVRLRRPAGGVLDADHVRSGDGSIDVAVLVVENQLDVGCALDLGYIVDSARLTTRTVGANVALLTVWG